MRFWLQLIFTLLALALPTWSEPVTSFTGFVSCQGRGWAALRTQQEYQDFVARIPRQRLQMKQPAPPSTDPLLHLPPFDFERDALIVAWSDNVYVITSIEDVRRQGEDLEIDLSFNQPGNLKARATPHGFGHYHLLRVESFKGQLKTGSIGQKSDAQE